MDKDKSMVLKKEISKLLAVAPVPGLTFREIELASVKRYEWTRRIGNSFRYMQVSQIDPIAGCDWEYSVLGGAYHHGDDPPREPEFDARRGGDLRFVVALFRRWLVDLGTWDEP